MLIVTGISDITDMFDIKFLVNKTANLLGIDTNIPIQLEKIEPDDTVNVFKSMFQYWNPKVFKNNLTNLKLIHFTKYPVNRLG